jgi:hypothetical protein
VNGIGSKAHGRSFPFWVVKKWSLFNVQLSFVIGGGASRNLFLNAAPTAQSENDKGQTNEEGV